MKKVIRASYKELTTRDRISDLEERIAELEDTIAECKADGCDIDDIADYQAELYELKEELNFAWQDDEAEYDYAVEQQEFNPDGSLALYSSTNTEGNNSMKKVVKAGSGIVSDAERAVDYANALIEVGVDEHDILIHFFDYLPSKEVIEILKDLANECDCEDEIEEILGR